MALRAFESLRAFWWTGVICGLLLIWVYFIHTKASAGQCSDPCAKRTGGPSELSSPVFRVWASLIAYVHDMGNRKRIFALVNKLSGGSLGILSEALRRFNEVHALEAAASMTYFALLSVFPLMLIVVALASFVLDTDILQRQLMTSVTKIMPSYQDRIRQDIEHVLALRRTVGIVGFVVLLWSATGFFSTLTFNINRAWVRAEMPGFLHRRLVALGIVVMLALFLILSVVSAAVVNLLSVFSVPLRGSVAIYSTTAWTIGTNLLPILLRFLAFLGLYRWVPNVCVKWSEALWGALVSTLGSEAATMAFTWYVGSHWARFELVYGSLGAIVALLVWIYVNSAVVLFGAHLSAAIARYRSRSVEVGPLVH